MLWAANAGVAPLQAQLIQFNLKQIGLDADIKLLPRAQQFTNAGNPKTATFDMTIERWGADYADPYDFVNILLDGNQVANPQHNNYAYFNVAKYNQQMNAASLLTGSKRGTAYAALDALDDEGQPAVGAARQLQRPQLHVCARWLPDAEHGPGRRAAPERDVPQVDASPGRGGPRGRPSQPSICEGGEPCSATSSDDSSGQVFSSSA